MNKEKISACPEFPFWGARYPDAKCINGKLYDLDKCDSDGLYEPNEDVACPFCKTESFIKEDYFGWVDYYCGELFGDVTNISIQEEKVAEQKAREAYLKWIEDTRKKYD